jgi:hypothetical protein
MLSECQQSWRKQLFILLESEDMTYEWIKTHYLHHKHPGLGHLAHSVSRVTVALSIVSLVSQLFSLLVGCAGIILKGFGFVAFFAGVKASSFCIHLSCLVCSLSVVRCEWSHLFCSLKGRNLPEVSIASFLPPQFFLLCEAVKVQFSDPYNNAGKTKVLCNFKIVFVLTFLKIVLLIVPINCKNFANLSSTSLENW